MSKKKLLSGREKELCEMAERYENAKAQNKTIYLDAMDLTDLADWYAVHEQGDLAMEVAEYGLKLHPDNTSLLIEMAYLHLEFGKLNKAISIAEQIDGQLVESKILKAQLLLTEGKEEEATRLLDTIEDKQALSNMTSVAYMYINMQYPEKAFEWLKAGLDKYMENEGYLSTLADAYYGKGMIEEAESTYNKLIDINPYSPFYWYGLARCYFDRQEFNKAIESCDYALISDEEFADAYLIRGHSYFYLGNETAALENLKEAARLGTTTQSFIDILIGLNKIEKGEWKEAYMHLEHAIENYDEDSSTPLSALYANAGYCLYKLKDTQKASEYLEIAHSINPQDSDVYLIEGKAHLENGDINESIKSWDKALECAPDAITWHEIGLCSMEAYLLDISQSAFEKVKELEPNFYGINEKLATLYILQNNEEKFAEYNKMCKYPLQPDEISRLHQLLKTGNKEENMKNIRTVLNTLRQQYLF